MVSPHSCSDLHTKKTKCDGKGTPSSSMQSLRVQEEVSLELQVQQCHSLLNVVAKTGTMA